MVGYRIGTGSSSFELSEHIESSEAADLTYLTLLILFELPTPSRRDQDRSISDPWSSCYEDLRSSGGRVSHAQEGIVSSLEGLCTHHLVYLSLIHI